MCFWATRYDCFADSEDFKLGVETIRRLLPEIEKELQDDRRVAQDFDWKLIDGNLNLPYPYIVSFTARPDNEYMWNEFAKDDGVVLEIDDCCNENQRKGLLQGRRNTSDYSITTPSNY